MTPLNTIKAKVLVVIKGKDYIQYLPPMKGDTRKKNLKSIVYSTRIKDTTHKSVML